MLTETDIKHITKRVKKIIEHARGPTSIIERVLLLENGPEIKSEPPSGYYKVKGMYVNPANGKCVIQYDDTPT